MWPVIVENLNSSKTLFKAARVMLNALYQLLDKNKSNSIKIETFNVNWELNPEYTNIQNHYILQILYAILEN